LMTLPVELLGTRLSEALRAEGYERLNYIQEQALRLTGIYRALLIVAPTGYGKTEAALLPVLRGLAEEGGAPIYALYVTPLRALNRDIYRRMERLAARLGYRMMIRHGDTPRSVRHQMAVNPPHIVITTPETLQFLLVGRRIREALKNVRWVVVDELHELMGSKRGSQLTVALERLKRLAGGRPRVVALSATLARPDEALRFISGGYHGTVLEWGTKKEYEIAVAEPGEYSEPAPLPKEFYARMKLLAEHARRGGVLIFTNTRDMAEVIGRVLRTYFGVEVRVHHGSLSREERLEVEEGFKSGKIQAVVATSSLELGIDVGHVRLVIQYGSPRQAMRLLQRVGRAGHRMGRVSSGLIVPMDVEDAVESAVLARRAERGNLEAVRPYDKPLDVLAHQVAGLAMEYGGIGVDDAYELVTRAYPYRLLSPAEFRWLLEFLDSIRVIRLVGDTIRRSRRTLEYYYTAASTIPETLSFDAVDLASRRKIGRLDQAFVSAIEEGKIIILAGRAWRVENIDYEKGVVELSHYRDEFGEPPVWTGETLPVERGAAREVGALYRRAAEEPGVAGDYGVPERSARELARLLREQGEEAGVIPSDRDVLVEVVRSGGRYILVVHSYLGTRGNNALALLLAYAVKGFYSCTARFFSDPYRVLVFTDCPLNAEKAKLLVTEGLEWGLERWEDAVRESGAYTLKLLHVAGRIGVVERSRAARLERGLIKNLKRRMKGTPLDVEALKEAAADYFDFEAVRGFLRRVRARASYREAAELSPMAQLVFEKPVVRSGVLASAVPLKKVVEIVRRRLENSRVRLVCLHCGGWETVTTVKLARSLRRCPRCGSLALAVLSPFDEETVEAVKKWKRGARLSAAERRMVDKARRSASLFATYGYRAVLVMAGHGVGPQTAARILSHSKDIETLVGEVLRAEAEYTRTRKYWSGDAKP